MTADEVVERWDDVSGESDDDFDDPDEPIMEGSDDEFSDLEDVDEDDGNNELDHAAEDPTAPPEILDSSMEPDSDTDSAAADSEPQWTATFK